MLIERIKTPPKDYSCYFRFTVENRDITVLQNYGYELTDAGHNKNN